MAFSQSHISNLKNSLENHRNQFPYEKVYLHTDKPHYQLNDTIWIKAYGTIENGALNPQPTATVPLYINLYQINKNEPVLQETMRLENGLGLGDMVLPRDLNPGVYHVIAYTDFSDQSEKDYLFAKDIWVGDIRDAFVPRIALEDHLELDFFPEGGDLVEGLSSTVGIKATGSKGLGMPFYGYLVNDKKDTLERFESNFMGMGRVNLTPKKGEKYKAYVKTNQMDWKAFELPSHKESGAVLSILLEEEKNDFEIHITEKNLGSQEYWLLGIAEGKLIYDI